MELLTLLHKSNYSDTNLSLAERAVLSVIICHINYKLEKGYEAWPSTDIIVTKTGLSTSGISKCRKALVANGWVVIVSGRKAGVANHYFVNAEKIINAAATGGAVHSGKSVATTSPIPLQAKQHERNVSNLQQGAQVKTLPALEVAVVLPETNTDGSKPFHYGVRCFSYADHKKAEKQRIEEMNELDAPF